MLLRNVLFNLVGLAAPIVVALLCIPLLILGMGELRFGLLTLVWVVLGYFSIFDLGIGRALTQAVAERRARGEARDIGRLVATAFWLTLALGLLGGCVLAAATPFLAGLMIAGDPALRAETERAMWWVAAGLPLVTTTAGLRGVLEAYQRFDITNAIRLLMGVLTFAGPLLVIQFRTDLPAVVAFLIGSRFVTWAVHLAYARRVLPAEATGALRMDRAVMRPLLATGGWMTVSGVVSPLMTYMDRFFVASIAGVAVVAYYATPYEVMSRMTLIPEALLGVLFPALTAALVTDRERARRLYAQSLRILLVVMALFAALVSTFARELLSAWITPAFAASSFAVLQILALALVVNAVARLPYTVLQSAGRADLTAKLHLLELPVFVAVLVLLVQAFGIVGAALAWALRVTLDCALLLLVQRRVFRAPLDLAPVPTAALALLLLATLAPARLALPTGSTLALGLGLVAAVALIGWNGVLNELDRGRLRALLARLRPQRSG